MIELPEDGAMMLLKWGHLHLGQSQDSLMEEVFGIYYMQPEKFYN